MTTKHTPGRLAIKDRLLDGRCQFTILGGDGAIVAGVDARDNVLAGFGKENDARSRCADGQQEAWANAEHLVACWNACERRGRRRPPMPDKHEGVVAQLRVGPLCGFAMTDAQLDDIAAILKREYGDARRDALEEAARICDLIVHRVCAEDAADTRLYERASGEDAGCCARAIRAAKEEARE